MVDTSVAIAAIAILGLCLIVVVFRCLGHSEWHNKKIYEREREVMLLLERTVEKTMLETHVINQHSLERGRLRETPSAPPAFTDVVPEPPESFPHEVTMQ